MLAKPKTCSGCPLFGPPYGKPEGFVPAHGSGANGILIVGEAAGAEEERSGVPFVGPAGQKLNHLLAMAGQPRANFRIHNVLSCRPPRNELVGTPYEDTAAEHCRPNLDETIAAMKPKVIIALGATPLRRLTGKEGILRWRGRPVPLIGRPDIWVMPTLHPSFLLPRRGGDTGGGFRNPPRMTGVVVMDIARAVNIANNGFTRHNYFEPKNHLLDPTPWDFATWADKYEGVLNRFGDLVLLSFDIETPYKLKKKDEDEFEEAERDTQILRISFAYNNPDDPTQQFQGVSVPWSPVWMDTIARLLGTEGRKVVWNGDSFDVPLIRANGIAVNGRVEDFMWGWHMFQPDLPYGLEFVTSIYTDMEPWKEETNQSAPALYSAIDSVAALLNALGIERDLRRAA